MSKTIIGVQLNNRVGNAPDFQSMLSKYGSIIQTRIGLHSASNGVNPGDGVILLDFIDEPGAELDRFKKELTGFGDVKIQQMVF